MLRQVFALMFDAPWAAVQRAWGVAGALLDDDDVSLEPDSVFVWSVRRNQVHQTARFPSAGTTT